MRLRVEHRTEYHYDQPMRHVVQSLRLTPSEHDGQRVLNWQVTLDCEGAHQGPGFRDGAGDWVQGWTVSGLIETVPVVIQGEVEVTDTAGVLRGHRERMPPQSYLRSTRATHLDEGLRDLAASARGVDGLDLSHRLMERVADAIAYRPGATEAHTTAGEALALGEGVCQDHAQALIAVARHHGLPARYVSGYLQADADGTPHEAAHGWAEIHLDGLGWVGFDPANRCCPDARYIRIGSGLDAAAAAPVRGVAAGIGSERMDVTVAVAQVGQ